MEKITLKAARVNAGFTQEEVAKVGGIARTTIIAWESGKSMPDHLQILGLASLYKVPVDLLLLPQPQG